MSPPEPDGAAAPPPLPAAVRELIERRIDSVVELEALLLLCSEPDRAWNANEVARRLYVADTAAAEALRKIAQRGLAASQGDGWCYAPESAVLGDAVSALSQIYSQRLVAVTTLIHGKTARGIQEFARAFVIRRKE